MEIKNASCIAGTTHEAFIVRNSHSNICKFIMRLSNRKNKHEFSTGRL